MKPFQRLTALRPVTKVLVGFALVLAVAAAVFDWNWFRRPLERYLMEKSGREVNRRFTRRSRSCTRTDGSPARRLYRECAVGGQAADGRCR
jgi:hypothetical protein